MEKEFEKKTKANPETFTEKKPGKAPGDEAAEKPGADAGANAGAGVGAGAGANAGTGDWTDAETDSGANAGTDARADAGTDAGAGAGTTPRADAGVSAGANAGTTPGADAGTTPGADAGTAPETKTGKKKNRIWMILFVLINVGVVVWAALNEFNGKPEGSIGLKFTPKALLFLACTAGCLAVLLLAETLKYCLMMRSLKEPVSFRVAFETAVLGKYYDSITPSGAGGQPFQIYWLHKHGYSDGGSSAMPITGYVTAQFGFILLALGVFIFWRSVDLEAIRYTAYAGLVLFSLIPFLLVLFSLMPETVKKLVTAVIRFCGKLKIVKNPDETTERVIDMLNSYNESFNMIVKDKATGLCLLGLSLIFRVALCSMPYFVLKMFGASVKFMPIFCSTIYIYASIALVPTPGNAGAAEGAFYLVFSAMGSNGVFWAMLIWRLFSHYSFIIAGGVVYAVNAIEAKRRGKKIQNSEFRIQNEMPDGNQNSESGIQRETTDENKHSESGVQHETETARGENPPASSGMTQGEDQH